MQGPSSETPSGNRKANADSSPYHLAYVFERFPSFTQTFCVREVLELERQGIRPQLFSIRDTRDETPRHFPDELYDRVIFLPPEKELVDEVKQLKAANRLPQSVVLTLRHWGERPDKMRVYEAAWIGLRMQDAGVRHAHSHFAGLGARACWWLRFFYDITFSFTGHANDVFCESGHEISLEKLMHDASLIVTVSDFTVADLQHRFPPAARKIRRVYNGLDLQPFHEAAARRNNEAVWSPKDGKRQIFSVGRLIEKKGFDDLIRACAILKNRGRKDFICRIAGDGPLEDGLRAIIAELGVEDLVVLSGPRSQREIAAMLRDTAIFALPCVTEKDGGKDNLPTVLMEAMAAALPCASTILAGVPEMVIDGATGRLVPERQPEAFAGILEVLLNDPQRSREMGRRGQERALALFAKEVTARQLRRHLISHGLVKFDATLIAEDPALFGAYVRQWLSLRLTRLFRKRPKKDRIG